MKLNRQLKYYLKGTVVLFCAMFCITLLPTFLKFVNFELIIGEFTFVLLEFFLCTLGAILYLFSPKYYKWQVITVLLCVLYYFLFKKAYLIIF